MPEEGEAAIPEKAIEQVIEERSPDLMEVPGVVGVGQGLSDGEPCVVVMVASALAELERRMIPDRIEGYPVTIRVTGEFRARGGEA